MEPFHPIVSNSLRLGAKNMHSPSVHVYAAAAAGSVDPRLSGGFREQKLEEPPLPPLTQVCTLTEFLLLSRLACHKIITSSGFEPWSSKSSKPFLSLANSLCVPGKVLGSEDTVDRIVQVSALWRFHSSRRRQVITHQTNE